MATYAEKPESEYHSGIKDQTKELIQDVKNEVTHEVSRIQTSKEPVDPSHSDRLVRRHIAGLSIWFFVAIAFFLIAAIAGIMIYTQTHH
ncbi:hypothetical protein [Acidicapsa acidisoli]|uniref:hypothetical protein n=1 Tax=Acidicapsa acidisoli TaxID=1615681 RepID=UPI0021DF45F0|nr:hypothetical protein [Acidicapsa acidisoli]